MYIRMIWPDHDRVISLEKAQIWVYDAIANQEVDDPLLKDSDVPHLTMREVVDILNDSGHVTLVISHDDEPDYPWTRR